MIDPAKIAFDDIKAQFQDATAQAVGLLTHYSFDLGDDSATGIVDRWLKTHPAAWIRWAIIEALYQGRYKAISVDQILLLWQRRQQPCYHFNYEFERLVSHKFPRDLSHAPSAKIAARSTSAAPTRSPQSGAAKQPPISKPVSESTVLPALPVSKTAFRENVNEPSPAWVALAEQIQQDEFPDSSQPAIAEPTPEVTPALIESEPLESEGGSLRERVARLQAGVEALIEQATFSLNASADAAKTRLQHDEEAIGEPEVSVKASDLALPIPDQSAIVNRALNKPETASSEPLDEVHPPIHQFTPAPSVSEFHSKLKAVAEQED